MAKVYFGKEIPATQFMIEGAAVPFETLSRDMGVIELDSEADAKMIEVLNKTAGSRGIIRLSAEAYQELKKKPKEPDSPPPWSRANTMLRVQAAFNAPKSPAPPVVNPNTPPPEPPPGPRTSLRGFKPKSLLEAEAEARQIPGTTEQ